MTKPPWHKNQKFLTGLKIAYLLCFVAGSICFLYALLSSSYETKIGIAMDFIGILVSGIVFFKVDACLEHLKAKN